MFRFKKVQFTRSKDKMCIYLDDDLFYGNKKMVIKKIINLFRPQRLHLKCTAFSFCSDSFVEAIETTFRCSVQILTQKKNRQKVFFELSGGDIDKLLDVSAAYDNLIEIDFCDTNNVVFRLVINDNDGSCVVFDAHRFREEEIKTQVENILKPR